MAAFEGAYFAGRLSDAKAKGRIGKVTADPLLPLRAFIDIGGSGALADAFTIWIAQWVGQEIRILDYYEAVGQVLAFHVNWLRARGYRLSQPPAPWAWPHTLYWRKSITPNSVE